MRVFKKIILIIMIINVFLVSTSLAKTGSITAQAARIRKENNTSSNIITNVYKGDEVEILEESGDWYKVKSGNNTGYIKKEFVTEKESNSTTNTSNTANQNVSTSNETNTQNASTNVAKDSNQNTSNTSSNSQNTSNTTNNQNVSNTVSNTNSQNNVNTQNLESQNTTIQNSNSQTNNSVSDEKILISKEVNLRITPNLMSSTIKKIEAGKELTKLSEFKNWIQVSDENVIGWLPKAKVSTAVQDSSNETDSELEKPVENNNNSVSNNVNTSNTDNTSNATTNNTSNNQTETSSNKTGKVNVETAKVREKATQSSKFIRFLDYGDTVTIIDEEGDWYKITSEEVSGYIKKTLVTVSEKNVSSRGAFEERARVIDVNEDSKVNQEMNNALTSILSSETSKLTKGEEIADYAKKYLGVPYVLGGKTPETGFDCSGFTRYVFLNFGYTLGTTAANQNNLGVEISKEDLKSGDLILFYDEGKNKIGHTGIYISNGEFIHAANPQRGVVTDNLNTNTYYNERFIIARRIAE